MTVKDYIQNNELHKATQRQNKMTEIILRGVAVPQGCSEATSNYLQKLTGDPDFIFEAVQGTKEFANSIITFINTEETLEDEEEVILLTTSEKVLEYHHSPEFDEPYLIERKIKCQKII